MLHHTGVILIHQVGEIEHGFKTFEEHITRPAVKLQFVGL